MTGSNQNDKVSIQDVTALQVLPNDESTILAKGDLTATSIPATSTDDQEPILILTIGQSSSFPLTSKTVCGTFDDRPNVFSFQLDTSGSLNLTVQLVLPQGIDDPLHPANADYQRFEDLLIQKGLLLTGIKAVGNEIASGIREGTRKSQDAISKAASERTGMRGPVSIDPNTHSVAQKAAESTANAASYTSSFASSIGSMAAKGGESVGRGVRDLGKQAGLLSSNSNNNSSGKDGSIQAESNPNPTAPEKQESGIWSDTKSAASEAGQAISQGASALGASIAQASEKTLGSDFNKLASTSGEAVKNTGTTTLNALKGTSMIAAGGNVAAGTHKGLKEEDDEGEKRGGVNSEGDFVISE